MAAPRSKLTSQGQISVPAEIRRKLGVGPGAVLEWDDEGGQIVVRRVGRFSFADVHNAVFRQHPARKTTIEDMNAGVRRHMRTRHARG